MISFALLFACASTHTDPPHWLRAQIDNLASPRQIYDLGWTHPCTVCTKWGAIGLAMPSIWGPIDTVFPTRHNAEELVHRARHRNLDLKMRQGHSLNDMVFVHGHSACFISIDHSRREDDIRAVQALFASGRLQALERVDCWLNGDIRPGGQQRVIVELLAPRLVTANSKTCFRCSHLSRATFVNFTFTFLTRSCLAYPTSWGCCRSSCCSSDYR